PRIGFNVESSLKNANDTKAATISAVIHPATTSKPTALLKGFALPFIKNATSRPTTCWPISAKRTRKTDVVRILVLKFGSLNILTKLSNPTKLTSYAAAPVKAISVTEKRSVMTIGPITKISIKIIAGEPKSNAFKYGLLFNVFCAKFYTSLIGSSQDDPLA